MKTKQVNTNTERREQERRQVIADLLVKEMAALSRLARICPPYVASYLATAIESLDAAILELSSDMPPADNSPEMDA